MKILFLNYEYPPLGGGAANATEYLFKEFSKIPGLEVDLITSSAEEKYSQEKVGENITIHRLNIGKDPKKLHYQSQFELAVYAWKAFWFTRKLCRDKKYDLTHSFFSVPCGFISWRLNKKFGLPYIVSLRGADVPGYSERFSLLYKILTPLIRKIWKDSQAVVSNSQGLKELALRSNQNQKIDVIYNGIDTEEFRPSGDSKDEFTLLCASRLTERKGINYLLEALSILKTKHPDIRLLIVGEGNAEEDLKNQAKTLEIETMVNFLGRVPHAKMPEIYQRASAFVLPSLNEGMSNTVLEAIATGLPIIATDTGGTRELVQEEENGFIIKMRDARDIADKVELLVVMKELQGKMAGKSRRIAEGMSWKNVAEKYWDIYEKIKNQ